MIRIEKSASPACLTDEGPARVARHRAIYDAIPEKDNLTKAERDSFRPNGLYKRDEVKEALIVAQAGEKCAYCERELGEGGAHVDHFRPFKAIKTTTGKIYPGYFWLGYAWTNLYLSCLACNSSSKRDHFPLWDPAARVRPPDTDTTPENPLLINPAEENPREHIRFRGDAPYPYKASIKGSTTIEILRLQTRSKLRVARSKKLRELERLRDLVAIYRKDPAHYFELKALADESLTDLCDAIKRSAEFSSMAQDLLGDFLTGICV